MAVAERLDRALRAAAIPIVGVSVGREDDRATWAVQYDDTATDQERTDGDALVQAFDPVGASVIAAEKTALAVASLTPTLRAFYLFWFRKTYERDPTSEERAADTGALVQAFRDVS